MKKLYLLAAAAVLAGCSAATPAPEAAEPAAVEPTVAAAPTEAMAPTIPAAAVTVTDVWARTSPMEATNGAAYMVITNAGPDEDKLVGAMADVSDAVEIHQTTEEGGMMKMSPVEAVPVPAGGTAELKPGGYHIMFIGLKNPLKAGDTFPLILRFARSGDIEVQAEVRAE